MAQPLALSGATQNLVTSATRYSGFSIRETAGAAAVVKIWDNASASSGTLLDTISLVANESAREFYPGEGKEASFGIRVQIVSGSVEGSILVGGA